jgi:hypothetical protein
MATTEHLLLAVVVTVAASTPMKLKFLTQVKFRLKVMVYI